MTKTMRSCPALSRTLVLGALLAAGTLAGCGGHGKYTTEKISKAKENMNVMKSATEWEMARQSFLAGDLDKALKAVDRSIALNPQVAKSHVLRGRILMEMGRLDEGLASMNEAKAADPEHVEAPYYAGIIYERIQEREKALAEYTQAAELDPENPQYAIAAAEVMIDLGRRDDAERYLLERNAAFQHHAGVKQVLGHIAVMRGDHERATTLFNEARLLAPEDGAILEDLARAQMESGKYADADMYLERLLAGKEGEGRRDLKHMRARCLIHLNRPMDARALLIELTEGPEGQADADAWIGLGGLAYMLNDNNRLRQSAARAIAIAPDRAEGYMLQALWQRRRGDSAGAAASLAKAAERQGGQDAQAMLDVVRAELNAGGVASAPGAE